MEMRYEDENIWLTQKMMSALYDASLPTINEHIKKIYDDGELIEEKSIMTVQNKYSDFRYIPILSHCKPGTQDILIVPGITLQINRNTILRSNRAIV